MTARNCWRMILISLCAVASMWAQDSRGTLLGRVTDPTAAAVAGAKVDVLNTNTGVHYSSTTNSTGDFLVPYLIPGAYEITIDNSGFKTYRRSGITLQQGQRLTLDVTMELGGTAEIVEVTGEVPLVDTSTASVGQVVESRQILDLPTKDGNALVLATLVPGVVFTPQTAGYVRPFDTFSPSMMSVNGTRPGSNEFLVDGSPNIQGTEIAYSPAASVLSEFKVQTSTFDPSWGFNTGAAVNFTTKSGTNTPHGVIRYNHLNPVLNADKYFRLPQGKPQLRTHHFDTSFSGPVYIPKVYDGHNKTFFTVGFEAGRWFDPTPFYVQAVPTEAMRRGDFSQLLAISPAYQIYDPLTTRPIGNGLFERDPFPGNIIPADRINPIAAKMAALMDLPNQAGEADGTNNHVLGRNMQDDYQNFLVRIDHTLTDSQRIFGRFYITSLERPEYISNNNMVGDTFYRYNRGFVLSHVYAVSPTTVVESRYSFMRFRTGYIPMQQGWDLAALGFSNTFINQLKDLDSRALKLPNFEFDNYFAGTPIGGANSNNNRADMIHEPNVNVTKVVASHTIQSGVAYRAYLRNGHNLGDSSGSFTFDSTFTRGPFSTSSIAPMGQDFASFLLGIPASGEIPINASFAVKQSYWAFYIKDDWKVKPNLTLTLGLRYELPSSLTERFDRSVAAFDPTAELPIASQAEAKFQQSLPSGVPGFNVQGGLTFAGVNGVPRGLWQRSTRNFMPRIGIAYSITPTTVLRAGYGIFFEPLGINRVNVNQTGFSSNTAFVPTLDNGQTYVADLTNPFPNGLTPPVGASLGASTFLGQNISFFDPNLKNPYVQTWQIGLQRELPFRAVIEASYVGNRGTRMRATRDFNAVPNEYLSTSPTRDQARINFLNGQVANPFYPLLPGTNLAGKTVPRSQLLRPFPQFGTVQAEINSGYTWYHGLQARVEKRFSSGFSATYSFTWAKSMQATSYLNPGDPNPEEVVSDLDRPFRNTVMVNYELPFGRGKRWGSSANGLLNGILGGWQLNGVYTLQSGQALGFGNAILTCSPDQVALPSGQRTVQRWFNTDCFNRTSSQQLAGNIRTAPSRFSGIRAPGVNNFDLSLMKRLQIREGTQLILIGQAINALNHAQFTPPNTTPTSSAFGRITNEYAWQRIVQVGARLQF